MLLLTSEDPEREIESLDNRLANEEIYLKLAENLESFLARLRDTSASTGTAAIFRHTSNALMSILLLWMLAFNLLQLFIYRRLKRDRRSKDPTDTIRHIVEVMLRDVTTLPEPIPWATFFNTS